MDYQLFEDKDWRVRYVLLHPPRGTDNGSGMVQWEIESQTNPNDNGWTSDKRWVINTPAYRVESVLLMPEITREEQAAKLAAIRALLVECRNAKSARLWGLTKAKIAARANNNGRSDSAAQGVDTFIMVVLGASYPMQFALE